MRKFVAKSWQKQALNATAAAMARGRRAVLIQLPTGLGKTLVAVRLYNKWRKAGWKLIVSVKSARPEVRLAWKNELQLRRTPPMNRIIGQNGSRSKHGHICFITHSKLSSLLTTGSRSHLRPWLQNGHVLVVVDEVHRAKSLRERLAQSYWGDDDRDLARWLRRRRGRPPLGPRWVFMSATPYNPVRLDYALDTTKTDIARVEDEVERETTILYEEIRLTVGLLARLDRANRSREELDSYLNVIHNALMNGDPSTPKQIPVSIVPRETEDLGPRPPRPDGFVPWKVDPALALKHLLYVHQRLAALPASLSCRATTVERLVLAGVRASAKAKKNYLLGHQYVTKTVKGVRAAQFPRRVAAENLKLATLTKLIAKIQKQSADRKVVIFCVHRAVASAVAKHLRERIEAPGERVHDATQSKARDEKIQHFQKKGSPPFILVATDVLSESIDLHQDCHFLIHFELPWSPLRVLQRVGRLWRIKGDHEALPKAPNVFHVIHPCSVEEEILSRLQRRWDYLKVLGLGYMPIRLALGRRLPQVDW